MTISLEELIRIRNEGEIEREQRRYREEKAYYDYFDNSIGEWQSMIWERLTNLVKNNERSPAYEIRIDYPGKIKVSDTSQFIARLNISFKEQGVDIFCFEKGKNKEIRHDCIGAILRMKHY